MDHRPSDLHLVKSDHADVDGKYDVKLIDFLRRRQRPVHFVIDGSGEVIYSCGPDWDPPEGRTGLPVRLSALTVKALQTVQSLMPGDTQQHTDVRRRIIVDEPGEKCAIVTLERAPWCLRIFKLYSSDSASDVRYSALLEPIEELQPVKSELQNVKGLFRLSKREADVVQELASGSTDKQIASQLGISVETVRAYLKSIRAKLGVSTRTAIVSVIHNLREDGELIGD